MEELERIYTYRTGVKQKCVHVYSINQSYKLKVGYLAEPVLRMRSRTVSIASRRPAERVDSSNF